MKKNLIALAILAASGVASAQSSVTVYGIADVWFGSTKNEAAINPTRQTKIDSGGVDQSRFGFKGTEDLGAGLKANFVLEQGFNIDNGSDAITSQAFSRQSYVGLSSAAMGEVRLGKTLTPFDDISGATTPGFNSALSPSSNVWLSTNYAANPANTIYYASPSFSGFSGAASYSLHEDKNTIIGGNKAGRTGSFNVKYEGGPVYVGFAYQYEKAAGPVNSVKFTRLNGSYDLGVVKLLAGYGRVSDQDKLGLGGKTTEWQIGADFPVTSALTLSGGYARSKDNAALGNAKRTGLGLAASYSLSKRTSVYGGVQAANTKQNGVADVKSDLYAVGVRHTF
ncbi:MAG: porin [Polaromonas sp.]|nr:porin [Polaromonas sp.]